MNYQEQIINTFDSDKPLPASVIRDCWTIQSLENKIESSTFLEADKIRVEIAQILKKYII